MKQKDLDRFRKILLEQKSGLLNKSNKFKEERQEGKEMLGDEIDLATTEINLNLDIRLHERERVLIHKIEVALSKIASGQYGFCEECEEPLELKRLEARPVATLCIACKEDQEDREKIYAFS
ncbi:MAG TPA: RNA polymerase-binding protein DksA [Bdellovibrionales bacterium]|nr:RNA polymerase-binding protein DksA [Bdellovibrionales bacterium]